ncbi:MAG: ActS/PrrB/RegB family redox-sensitive histidine kinase [Yoonia sp.]|uniref:sensor histidine kinase RegB n=1 Tax=Yoonia sp. TaxID=2212373 RepID=UPI00273E3DCE|nr:ActS/PrrB/RegB family redox-sensitive histidine kinase [Yoonia sp.]MDP5086689.1 ActS/PrrB/RegB family redox-sensitive histidine kinase [Yoonia sp.]MDP5361179.1 ActS/PrrB/RegB family redox-sensitive histidine kinase [Paracoccaceae bacterium]
MAPSEFQLFNEQERSNWVRLRTLVALRWFAIIGQTIAILVAVRVYNIQIEVGMAALVITLSVMANIISSYTYPENKRLSEVQATLWLVFDIVQLGLLLFLTGGLNNPFAMLILAPVTIAATVLHLRNTIFLGLMTICLVTVISRTHLPLISADGNVLSLPNLFEFGFWVALLISVVFLALYARQVTTEMHAMGEALVATQLALAREQKLTDLGGVVAAAAHELGTPLATIKLVSSELKEELENHPELLEDAELIRQQADRCRDILQSMGQAGKDDLHLRQAPVETVVREAADPHINRGKAVLFYIAPEEGAGLTQPIIRRRPEIIHGLRNLIQNAVDFSRSAVWVEVNWTDDQIVVRISDDGDGFPQSVIGRIGDPYVRRRRLLEDGARRPGYEGMGLGLFIAKTLLERSGAKLTFTNSRRHGHASWNGQATGGAVVEVIWPRNVLQASEPLGSTPLGKNQPIATWP